MAADYAQQKVLSAGLASVSSVFDAYIGRADQLSAMADAGIDVYRNMVSGEYDYYFKKAVDYKYCFDDYGEYRHAWYVSSDYDRGLDYWYDMLQKVGEYVRGRDADGNSNITNWPVKDTVEYFRAQFQDISAQYMSLVRGEAMPHIEPQYQHDWETEYGFTDIKAASLEKELQYGYDFMQQAMQQRKQFILDTLNNMKSQALGLQNLSQSIKNQLATSIASYNDNREDCYLGSGTVWAVSLNKAGANSGWTRTENKPPAAKKVGQVVVRQQVGAKIFYYTQKDSGEFAGIATTPSPVYRESDDILTRCRAVKAYMKAPTSFVAGSDTVYYDMMDEGVYAAVEQVQKDWTNLSSSVAGFVNQLKSMGYDFTPSGDVDENIKELIEFINVNVDETALEKDSKIVTYKMYIQAIVELSSDYLPVKYEYDNIAKDPRQAMYMSEFQPDTELTIASLDRLDQYRAVKDGQNAAEIERRIAEMKASYQEALDAYQDVALQLAGEKMLPDGFAPVAGYFEDMVQDMYDALREDVEMKTQAAEHRADDEYRLRITPAAQDLLDGLRQYADATYPLGAAVRMKLKDLYYLDDPAYARQKEMFLTYGGRPFCYYPYYNLKNLVHSSYQVHPFLWNFIKRETAYGLAVKTFYSVNVDELEDQNVAANWRKFFGEYGESKYLDLSRPRYPDYSGYQSRYEDSGHVADSTLFVSEVVDYDGAFFPPAVQWIRDNGLGLALCSLADCQYN